MFGMEQSEVSSVAHILKISDMLVRLTDDAGVHEKGIDTGGP